MKLSDKLTRLKNKADNYIVIVADTRLDLEIKVSNKIKRGFKEVEGNEPDYTIDTLSGKVDYWHQRLKRPIGSC